MASAQVMRIPTTAALSATLGFLADPRGFQIVDQMRSQHGLRGVVDHRLGEPAAFGTERGRMFAEAQSDHALRSRQATPLVLSRSSRRHFEKPGR